MITVGGFYVCELPCPELAISGDNQEYGYVTSQFNYRKIVEVIELLENGKAICKGESLLLIQTQYLE